MTNIRTSYKARIRVRLLGKYSYIPRTYLSCFRYSTKDVTESKKWSEGEGEGKKEKLPRWIRRKMQNCLFHCLRKRANTAGNLKKFFLLRLSSSKNFSWWIYWYIANRISYFFSKFLSNVNIGPDETRAKFWKKVIFKHQRTFLVYNCLFENAFEEKQMQYDSKFIFQYFWASIFIVISRLEKLKLYVSVSQFFKNWNFPQECFKNCINTYVRTDI